MSISATRRVTGSPRTDRNYTVSRGHGESFVENVDTSNNVFINDDVRNDDIPPPMCLMQSRPSPPAIFMKNRLKIPTVLPKMSACMIIISLMSKRTPMTSFRNLI